MFNLINSDLKFIARNKGLDSTRLTTKFRCALSPSFICSCLYRTSHQAHSLKIPLLAKIIWWVNFLLFKVDIDYRAKLYSGIYMPHPIGIVIGDGVHSTANIKIMQGSTLGGNLGRTLCTKNKIIKQPHFFADSFIGINSVILGPLIFEESVCVAANAIVTKQMPAGLLYGTNEQKPLTSQHQESFFK